MFLIISVSTTTTNNKKIEGEKALGAQINSQMWQHAYQKKKSLIPLEILSSIHIKAPFSYL